MLRSPAGAPISNGSRPTICISPWTLTPSAGVRVYRHSVYGNSSAPHLHFHVMDGPDPLAANGLPFVVSSFRLDQRVGGEPALDKLFAGQPAPVQPGFAARDVSGVMPLVYDIMNYSAGQ